MHYSLTSTNNFIAGMMISSLAHPISWEQLIFYKGQAMCRMALVTYNIADSQVSFDDQPET
jgi:hypothetical protein